MHANHRSYVKQSWVYLINHIYFLDFLKADSKSVKSMIDNQIIQVRSAEWCGWGGPWFLGVLSATILHVFLLLQVDFNLPQLIQSKSDIR